MKKIVAMIVCLCMLLGLAACSSPQEGASSSGGTSRAPRSPRSTRSPRSSASSQMPASDATSAESSSLAEPPTGIEALLDTQIISFIGKTNGELIDSFGLECTTELLFGGTPVVYYTIDEYLFCVLLESSEENVNYGDYWPPKYDFSTLDNPYPRHYVIFSIWAHPNSILQTEEEVRYDFLCSVFGQMPEIEFLENEMDGDSYQALFTWGGYRFLFQSSYADLSLGYVAVSAA